MKNLSKYCYIMVFWISRFFSVSIFGICLFIVLHVKYMFSEKYAYFVSFFINENHMDSFIGWLFNIGIGMYLQALPDTIFYLFSIFCNNSQKIVLLLITLVIILILSMTIVKFINKEHKYLLTFGVISSIVYLTMYSIFKLPIMLALTISTPIILSIIYFLNSICPIQKIIMLIPVIGEICCTKAIIKYIFQKTSTRATNIFLLIMALILTNIICFLFPCTTSEDFKNLLIKNETYSARILEGNMIISGNKELIVIDKYGNNTNIKNDVFSYVEDFIIDKSRNKIYFCNFDNDELLVTDTKTLTILNKFYTIKKKSISISSRLCCNKDFSKLLIVFETFNACCLIDLDKYKIIYVKEIPGMRDGLIYNKYRDCFLISFHDRNSFLQEIDVENKKMRKIKADKYQGYLAISERNKEIYVAFHQQGRIGVYDAETMKLKRKIKSNYTVKDITYDEELNILIAPSYFTGYVDIFLMDGSDKLLTREFVGYGLREGCFDPQKENLYVCSTNGLYKKKIDIRNLIKKNSKQ